MHLSLEQAECALCLSCLGIGLRGLRARRLQLHRQHVRAALQNDNIAY